MRNTPKPNNNLFFTNIYRILQNLNCAHNFQPAFEGTSLPEPLLIAEGEFLESKLWRAAVVVIYFKFIFNLSFLTHQRADSFPIRYWKIDLKNC